MGPWPQLMVEDESPGIAIVCKGEDGTWSGWSRGFAALPTKYIVALPARGRQMPPCSAPRHAPTPASQAWVPHGPFPSTHPGSGGCPVREYISGVSERCLWQNETILISKSDWKLRESVQTVIKDVSFQAEKDAQLTQSDTGKIKSLYLTSGSWSIKMIKRSLSDCSKEWNRDLALPPESFRKQFPWIQITVLLLETSCHAPIVWLPAKNSWPVSSRIWMLRQFANDFLLPISATTLEVS